MTTNPANFPPPVNISAAYPRLLGVFCDKCDTTFEGDFLVAEDWTKAQRLDCVRTHVREKLGWACDDRGDFCPACRPAPDREAFTIGGETFTVTRGLSGAASVAVALHADGRLGYLAAQQEWVDGVEPLPDEIQDAAGELVRAGLLPEFEEWFR